MERLHKKGILNGKNLSKGMGMVKRIWDWGEGGKNAGWGGERGKEGEWVEGLAGCGSGGS